MLFLPGAGVVPPGPYAPEVTSESLTYPFVLPDRLVMLEHVSSLLAINPFDPAWEETLKAALRGNYRVPYRAMDPFGDNCEALDKALGCALGVAATCMFDGTVGTPREMAAYQAGCIVSLWNEFGARLQQIIDADGVDVPFYDEFLASYRFSFGRPGLRAPEPGHLLALFYQARRAWYFAATLIRGTSPSAAAARAAIWQANMVADLCAYADDLYRRMEEIPVLITGETGTGKELAARCVGWSRYIPFDLGARRFIARYSDDFHARNLCEVPRDLLESALFGHKRGSFSGAVADATGFFALPKPGGALFLDEFGELPEHVQVKLLRPLQSREYVPLGETHPRPLLGRPIFATHRDLEAMCRDGTFRRDLYERIHGMRIHMPSLRQILAEAPEELRRYVEGFLADKLADPARVLAWTEKVVHAILTTRPL